jgi:hypothetical protein
VLKWHNLKGDNLVVYIVQDLSASSYPAVDA